MKQIGLSFFRGKRVLVTGHTGFKGTWLCRILTNAGANVFGYSRCSDKSPNFFEISGLKERVPYVCGDIRDYEHLLSCFQQFQPEIVFHLAAQPIVRESYREPRYTYETNVMGTVNLLECVRNTASVRSVLNITTDKVYLNNDLPSSFQEDDPLDGFEPYSNSKSCSELATQSYVRSFFSGVGSPAVSTARAGNVIGGGDFEKDRIIPDCIRSVQKGETIIVRNPHSTRPSQHVLDPLFAYLKISRHKWENPSVAGWYNVGPDDCDCVTTGTLVDLFCRAWGNGCVWINKSEANAPHEASFLKLDCTRLKTTFEWRPRWHIEEAIDRVCEWTRVYFEGGDIPAEMDRQIALFLEDA